MPTAPDAEYYGQLAGRGGLIATEATDVAEQARGYPGAPASNPPSGSEAGGG